MMLSTRLRLMSRWLRHDRLFAASIVWFGVTIVSSLFRPSLEAIEISLVVATVLMLLWLVPLDRWVLSLGCLGCLALAWVNWVGLERLSVPLTSPVVLTGTVVELPQTGDSTTRLTVAVVKSSQPALIGKRVTVDVAASIAVPAGSTIQASAGPLRVSQNTLRLDPVRNLVAHLTAPSITVIDPDRSTRGRLVRIRERVVRRAAELWQQPTASLGAGLVVGNRANFDADLAAAMQTTGTTHLVAVSGANLVVVLWLLRLVLPRRRPWLRDGLLIIGLVVFALLSGGTASVVRAVLLATALLMANLIGRPTHSLRILALVATGMVVANPFLPVFDLGFQLSFAATASLVTIGPMIAARLPGPRTLRILVGISLGAYLATAPIIAGSFGIVSLSAPFVNVVVQPLTFVAMVAAAAALGLSFVWLPLGHLLAWLSWPLLAAIIGIIQWFAHQPIPVLALTPPAWLVWLGVAVCVFGPAWLQLRTGVVGSSAQEETDNRSDLWTEFR